MHPFGLIAGGWVGELALSVGFEEIAHRALANLDGGREVAFHVLGHLKLPIERGHEVQDHAFLFGRPHPETALIPVGVGSVYLRDGPYLIVCAQAFTPPDSANWMPAHKRPPSGSTGQAGRQCVSHRFLLAQRSFRCGKKFSKAFSSAKSVGPPWHSHVFSGCCARYAQEQKGDESPSWPEPAVAPSAWGKASAAGCRPCRSRDA